MPDNRVVFAPNVPHQVALKSEVGAYESGPSGDIVRFDLVDGRTLCLAPDVARKLFLMEIQPGETFHVCMYWNGERKQPVRWSVWLSSESEQARASAEEDQTATLLEQSIAFSRNGNGRAIPKALEGLQSSDPASPSIPAAPVPTLKRTPPPLPKAAIPWNVAFRETSAWVASELKTNSLQWSDEAQQAMVCTVLIQEAKAGRIGPWERGQ